jgi:ABC-2 type transport system ATP-binding protein
MADAMTYPAPPAMSPSRGDVALRTVGLTKQYGSRVVVNNLNMEVRRGDIFGFLGPNGAGKTTTIRMMLGLITPTSGNVEILGHPITSSADPIFPRIGALVETPALYPYMSGRNNLRAINRALGSTSEAHLDAILDLVGLGARQKDRVRTYSLGMKQRLGVAMAMLNNPEVLILDEPANGLDPAGIVEMRDLMRALAAQGKTIFISSHVLGEVQQLCTRVAIINLGRLITESTVEELTRGQGNFVVYVEQAPEAVSVIQAQPWGKTAQLDPASGAIITAAPENRGRNLNAFLVQAGFVPDGIMYQGESLEQVFLRLTGGIGGVQ